jgi:microcin C transport system ATP-binding protein
MRLPLLQVRDLRIGFQAEDVVKGISFNLDLGEKLALVGESGSGKSVTALSFVKLLEGARVSGRVLWTAQDADTLAPEATDAPHTHDLVKLSERELVNIRGQDIAFVFQEPMTALNPLMMVGDQIAEVLELKRGMTRAEAWHEAVELLNLTGIPEPVRRASAYPHQLSGGQRQRVMIAMALACRPRLLVADEPTTALDVSLRAQILDLLNDLQKRFGMAVLLITHDLNTVRRFADQVLVMEKGVIVESGQVDVVLTYPNHPYTQKLIDSQPPRNVVEAKNNVPAVMQARALRVSYPIRRAGWRGWFKGDQFVAVQGASFDLRAGQTWA